MDFLTKYQDIYIYASLFIMVISLLRIIILQKRLNNYLNKSSAKNIEGLINDYLKKVELSLSNEQELKERILKLENEMLTCVKKVSIMRYNPFEEMGSNQCYAVALLNDKNDGFIINGIHDRDGSRTYAKPINKGVSEYKLSKEENEVLEDAKNQ